MGRLLEVGECRLAFGDNTDRLCAWCGAALPKGRRRWCRDECHRTFVRQHYWTSARRAALRRDGHRCVRCGAPEDVFVTLEVNHKIPCGQRRSKPGCWHHQSNLESLCHECHVDTTRLQRAAGLL